MFGNRNFRSRPRQVFRPTLTSYGNTDLSIISFATQIGVIVLQASDSPDKNVITNFQVGGTVAEVENNSQILPRSFINLNLQGTVFAQKVSVWVFRNARNMLTSPTSNNQFHTAPYGEDESQLRKHTIFFWSGLLDTQFTTKNLRIPLFKKRNNLMHDGTNIKMFIHNHVAGAGNLNYTAFMRIKTKH